MVGKWFAKLTENMPIKSKLLMVYLIAGVLPILGLGAAYTTNRYVSLRDFEQTQIREYAQTVKNRFFSITTLGYNVVQLLRYDKDIQVLLNTEYGSEEEVYTAVRNNKVLDNYVNFYDEIADIRLYTENETLFDFGRIRRISAEVEEKGWYLQAMESNGVPFWYAEEDLDNGADLSLVQYIKVLPSDTSAVLVIGLSNNYLSSALTSSKFEYLISLDGQSVSFSPKIHTKGKSLPFQIEGKAGVSKVYYPVYDGKKVMAADFSIYGINTNSSFLVITINDCLDVLRETVYGSVPILLLLLIVPLFLIWMFSEVYSKRVGTVRDEMHKVAGGNLEVMDSFEGKDELGELFLDMRATILSIKNLQDKVYQKELEAKKLENAQQQIQFELLSAQINPHFLFNTLESIRMQATLEGNEELSRIILQLGKMLRFSLESKNNPIPLQQEVAYLEAYFDIQKFRFEDKIKCEIHIQPGLDTKELLVLPLLLQPMVENAFRHGFAGRKRGGEIGVNILQRDEDLIMAVIDNGKGMPAERLEEIRESMKEKQKESGSIGLRNVNDRISMYYGEKYGVEISSAPGEGTTVVIRIPVCMQ